MEFFLSVAFLINDVERRFHYQYDSFQECNQAREAMVKNETGRQLWATCTRGKAPPPSVYQGAPLMRDAPSPKRKQLVHSLGRQGTRINRAIVIAITP